MKAEAAIERSMLAARWLLMPLYAVLMLILVVFLLKAGQEVAHIFTKVFEEDEAHLVLLTAVHLAFVLSALLLAWVDRMSAKH